MRAMMVCVAGIVLCGCGSMERQVAGHSAGVVSMYDVLEVSLPVEALPANPFSQAEARAWFVSPSGRTVEVLGFYYGGSEYRVRFVPRELGRWTYRARVQSVGAGRASSPVLCVRRGEFRCDGQAGHGFLRVAKRNAYRLEYADGTPFYPLGIQTCDFLRPDFDGPAADGSWRKVDNPQWLAAFKSSVNLVRTQLGQGTRAGCALPLIAVPPKRPAPTSAPASAQMPFPLPNDRYDMDLAAKVDEAYRLHRAAGMSQILILFQDMSLWSDSAPLAFGSIRDLRQFKSLHAPTLALQEQYIRYAVARWGAYVDIWEIFNEDAFAPDDYLAHLAGVIRAADPYGHLVTTNYARPGAKWADVITWHEYMGMPASQVDAYLCQVIGAWKSYGKPVLNTEFGNQGSLPNDDPVKWRVAVWTAHMNESSVLFWGMSGRKVRSTPDGNSNAYIGADSRGYFRVFLDFVGAMPVDMKPIQVGFHKHDRIRTYGLTNGEVTLLYVHHFADHTMPLDKPGSLLVQTGPGQFKARWIDPTDGREVAVEQVQSAGQFAAVVIPPMQVDLACRIDRLSETPSDAQRGQTIK